MARCSFLWVAVFFGLLPSSPVLAQTPSRLILAQESERKDSISETSDDNHLIEALPPHILRETGKVHNFLRANKLAGPTATFRGVFTSLYRWSRSVDPINVCFFDGTPDQRKLVVEVAVEWTKLGARIPLSFGLDPDSPSTCTGRLDDEHIRISFIQDGTIWSAVGTESVRNRRAYPREKPSMNLGYTPSIGVEKIRRAILHEFGHALGLEHEHQHPDAKCWPDEFDNQALVSWLRRTKGWSDEHVQANLELINRGGNLGIETTVFDRTAVMMYGFPARFYKKRDKSHCYAAEQAEISMSERELMSQLYPSRNDVAESLEAKRLAHWNSQLATLPIFRTVDQREQVEAFLRP